MGCVYVSVCVCASVGVDAYVVLDVQCVWYARVSRLALTAHAPHAANGKPRIHLSRRRELLLVVMTALFLFFYVGIESAYGGWIYLYARENFPLMPEWEAASLSSAVRSVPKELYVSVCVCCVCVCVCVLTCCVFVCVCAATVIC